MAEAYGTLLKLKLRTHARPRLGREPVRSRGQERAVARKEPCRSNPDPANETLVNWPQIASLWAAELFQFVHNI